MTTSDLWILLSFTLSIAALCSVFIFAAAIGMATKKAHRAMELVAETAELCAKAFKTNDGQHSVYESAIRLSWEKFDRTEKQLHELTKTLSDQDERVIRQVIEAINRSSN